MGQGAPNILRSMIRLKVASKDLRQYSTGLQHIQAPNTIGSLSPIRLPHGKSLTIYLPKTKQSTSPT
jgi:hypothetical protein